MKQTEGVPRGLLRFIVLNFLAEEPLSGVEIVEKIKQKTKGKWKPSPGSIYPLLFGLQQKDFTVESPKNEVGKQYTLTDEGKNFFKEQVMLGEKFMEKMRYLMPIFIEGFQCDNGDRSLLSAKGSGKKLLETFIELDSRKHTLTEKNIQEIIEILDESTNRLNKMIEKMDEI